MRVTLICGRTINPAVSKVADTLARNGYDVKLLVWDRQNTLRDRTDNQYEIGINSEVYQKTIGPY